MNAKHRPGELGWYKDEVDAAARRLDDAKADHENAVSDYVQRYRELKKPAKGSDEGFLLSLLEEAHGLFGLDNDE